VFDNIGGRIFLEQPARKDAAPALGLGRPWRALIDQKLHERALVGIGFPWRGLFTGAQADNDLAEPDCLAGLQFDIARLAVALVEKTEHRHALRHRCANLLALGRDDLVIGRLRLARFFGGKWLLLAATKHVASGKRKRDRGQQQQPGPHAASGLHAS
jgi:hypothetical protein